ncbi:unnamed protein product [Cochlearia groenlandica]
MDSLKDYTLRCKVFYTDCMDLVRMASSPHLWPTFSSYLEVLRDLQTFFPDRYYCPISVWIDKYYKSIRSLRELLLLVSILPSRYVLADIGLCPLILHPDITFPLVSTYSDQYGRYRSDETDITRRYALKHFSSLRSS